MVSVLRIHDLAQIPEHLRSRGIDFPRPVIVIVGGAGSLDNAELRRLEPLFTEGLAPLAESLDAAIVDGGTDAGVMRLIGQAHDAVCASFPLIGVAPAEKVSAPGDSPLPGHTQLESHHSMVMIVPASSWIEGSTWLSAVAGVLSKGEPSVTVVIGGGNVTWFDAAESVRSGRPVVAVGGTGHVADALSAAVHDDAANEQAATIQASGLLFAVDLDAGSSAVTAAIRRAFDLARSSIGTS